MPHIPISSFDDPRLDDYRNIPDPELLSRRGLFVAEGRLVVRRLLGSSRFAARSLLVTPTALADLGRPEGRPLHEEVEHDRPGHKWDLDELPVYVVDPHVMNAVAGFNIHRGCLAVGERGQPRDWRALAA